MPPFACYRFRSGPAGVLRREDRRRPGEQSAPAGFTALFNGKDLTGWHVAGTFDPRKLKAMPAEERRRTRREMADRCRPIGRSTTANWSTTARAPTRRPTRTTATIELLVDYKTVAAGRQRHLPARLRRRCRSGTHRARRASGKLGADKGSGGCGTTAPAAPGKDPLVLADKPFGEWNTFRIMQVGDRTSASGSTTSWSSITRRWRTTGTARRSRCSPKGPIQLQTHGGEIRWRNIYRPRDPRRRSEQAARAAKNREGFKSVFNGKDLDGWAGAVDNYEVVDGAIRCKPGKGGVLYHQGRIRRLRRAAGIQAARRAATTASRSAIPATGDGAYVGMCELQVLDTEAPEVRQDRSTAGPRLGLRHGAGAPRLSAADRPVEFRGSDRPGVDDQGRTERLVILDADLSKVTEYMANSPHPGKDLKAGHFGFAGHNDPVEFRNISIQRLKSAGT